MSCNRCGHTHCSCGQQQYTYNWYNIDNYPCNPCSTVNVCKKKIPAACTFYNGPALTFFNLGTNISIEQVIAAFATAIQTLQTENAAKNANIQTALNDINARINLIDGGSHPNYVI